MCKVVDWVARDMAEQQALSAEIPATDEELEKLGVSGSWRITCFRIQDKTALVKA